MGARCDKVATLPFARKEAEIIGKIVGCTPLIGRQATKNEVLKRLGSVALVHIAAHGKMETGEIALAPKSGETDFILTMKDVKSAQIEQDWSYSVAVIVLMARSKQRE